VQTVSMKFYAICQNHVIFVDIETFEGHLSYLKHSFLGCPAGCC